MPSSSLTSGGKVVIGAGVLFLICTLLPWYTVSVEGFGVSQTNSADAWDITLPKLAALLVILVLVEVILVQLVKVKLPQIPSGVLGFGRLAVSGLAALLVLVEVVKVRTFPSCPTSRR